MIDILYLEDRSELNIDVILYHFNKWSDDSGKIYMYGDMDLPIDPEYSHNYFPLVRFSSANFVADENNFEVVIYITPPDNHDIYDFRNDKGYQVEMLEFMKKELIIIKFNCDQRKVSIRNMYKQKAEYYRIENSKLLQLKITTINNTKLKKTKIVPHEDLVRYVYRFRNMKIIMGD